MSEIITAEKFWELFAEELPKFAREEYDDPREPFSLQEGVTGALLVFFCMLTEKLSIKLNLDLKARIELKKIDFSYYLNRKVFIAIESENVASAKIEQEIKHFDKVRNTSQLNVLIWYYRFLQEGPTTKDRQLEKIEALVREYQLPNLLLILGPDAGPRDSVDKYFDKLDGRDFQAYKFESNGDYKELNYRRILQAL